MPLRPDIAKANSAVLLWQSRFRLLLIIAVGGITLSLNWAGMLSADSVVANKYGVDRALQWTALLALLYFGFVGGLALYLNRKGSVGMWAVGATIAADVTTFNGLVLLGAHPDWYHRALILSMFSLMLSLLYFGWRTAMLHLLAAVAAYLGIVLYAQRMGGEVQVNESLWTLGVFTLGMTAFVTLHADLSARLSMIVRAFDSAREGAFTLSFDEERGGEPGGVTVIGRAYDKMRKQVTSLILTDPLTQCFNPRGFEQISAREIARAARADAKVTMLAIDLDHFKEINDTWGHLVGDDVLRDVGNLLRGTVRLNDVVARTGGEEFAILAPDTNTDGAAHLARRLLDMCQKHTFGALGDRHVTLSIGVSVAPARTEKVFQVLRTRADEALYAAKRAGRNRAQNWV